MGLIIYIIIIYIIYTSIKASKQKQKDKERSQRDWEIIQQRKEFIRQRMEEEKQQQEYQSNKPKTYNSWEDYSSGNPNLPKDVKLPPHMRTSQSNTSGRQSYNNTPRVNNQDQKQQNKFSHRQHTSSASYQQFNQRTQSNDTDIIQTPELNAPPIISTPLFASSQILDNVQKPDRKKSPNQIQETIHEPIVETKPMSMDYDYHTNATEITPASFDLTQQESSSLSSFEVKPVEITPMSFDSLIKPMESPFEKKETKTTTTEDDDTRKGSFFKEYGIEELKIEI